MGYIFRAFHALPRMANARGLPTQAALGFTHMLRKLLAEARPEYLAAAYDLPGPTFRDEVYAEYKANRSAMPEELAPQLPYIRRLIEAHGTPILEAARFEADDIIGTLAARAARQGRRVVVVSSDKDMLQLAALPGVVILNPSREAVYDAAGVEALLGVRPDQVADLMALRGDAIDNIPGAPGIGEKGSRELIARFGTIENLLAHAAEVERKTYRESLLQNREQILLSRNLAAIHLDAPIELDWTQLARRPFDPDACRELFRELEFHRLLRELEATAGAAESAPRTPPAAAAASSTPAILQPTLAELADWLARAPEPLALMPAPEETKAPELEHAAGPVIGLAASSAANSESLPALELSAAVLAPLRALLADPRRRWVVHDLRRVRAALAALGLPAPACDPQTVFDAQIASYLLDPTRAGHQLDLLARAYLEGETPLAGPGAQALALIQLHAVMHPQLDSLGLRRCYDELDLPLLPVLEAMEQAGIGVDLSQLARLSTQLGEACQRLEAEIFSLSGASFNLNSPKQMAEVLFEKLALPAPARRGKSQNLSTAVDVLEELAGAYPIAAKILEFRQLSKLKSTYVDALPPLVGPDGRLHTCFSSTNAATGRLSSSNPNLQNIPIRRELGGEIRSAFRAAPGNRLIVADYSQIELRLLADASQDPRLLDAFQSGEDIHRATAAEVFGVPPMLITEEHRRRAKAVNFGIVYGLSAFGLAKQLAIPQSEAAEFIRRYFERYAKVKQYIAAQIALARAEGATRTLWGRRRPIPGLASRNPAERGFAERTAINSPLQGSAADLIKLAMIRVHAQLPAPARLLLQVHDELVLEAPAALAEEVARMVRHEMESAARLSVPLRVETGIAENWRDA